MNDPSPEDPSFGDEAADHSGSLIEPTVDGVGTGSGSRPNPKSQHAEDYTTGTLG